MSSKGPGRSSSNGKGASTTAKPLTQNSSVANVPKLTGAKRQRDAAPVEPEAAQPMKKVAEGDKPLLQRLGSASRVLAIGTAASKPSTAAAQLPVPIVPPLPMPSNNVLDALNNDDDDMSGTDNSIVPAPEAATAPAAPAPAAAPAQKVAVNTSKPKAPAVVGPAGKKGQDKERRHSTSSTTSRSSNSFSFGSSAAVGAAVGAGLARASSRSSLVASRPTVSSSSSSSSAAAPSSAISALVSRGKAVGLAGPVAALGKVITASDTAKAIEVARKAEGAMKSQLALHLANPNAFKSYAIAMAKKNAMLQVAIEHHIAIIADTQKAKDLVAALHLDPALLTKLSSSAAEPKMGKAEQAKAAEVAAELGRKTSELIQLKNELTKASKSVKDLEADKARLECVLAASKSEVERQVAAAKWASMETMDVRNQLKSVEDELAKKVYDLEVAQKQMEIMKSRAKGQEDKLVAELTAMHETRLKALEAEKAKADADVKEHLSQISELHNELSKAKRAAEDALEKERKLAEEAGRKLAAQLGGEMEEVLKAKAEAEEKIASLTVQLAECEQRADVLHQEFMQSVADMEGVTQMCDQASASAAAAAEELMSVKAELAAEKEAKDSTQTSLDAAQAKIAELEAAMAQAAAAHQTQMTTIQGAVDFFQQRFEAVDAKRAALLEQVLTLKGAIRVMARVRPALPIELAGGTAGASAAPAGKAAKGKAEEPLFYFPDGSEDACSLEVHERPGAGVGGYGTANEGKQSAFSFNRVFPPTAGNEEVFSEVEGLVESALNGSKVCIFAYGQTGSGKTYTMQGGAEDPGLIPRSLHYLFGRVELMEGRGWTVTMQASMLEIYNESVRDLLTSSSGKGAGSAPELTLVQSKDGSGFEAKGLSAHAVAGPQDVEGLLAKAAAARAVSSTAMNAQSSRSHAVFTLSIRAVHSDVGGSVVKAGQLHLVDLAGSERLDKSGSEGQAKTEAAAINTSLTHLAGVIRALQTGDKHVPYRNSALTKVLQASLGGGSCKTLLLATLNPLHSNVQESLSTLRFASGVAKVETK